MNKCARCDERCYDCQRYTIQSIALCELCLDLIIQEWQRKRQEIGVLA